MCSQWVMSSLFLVVVDDRPCSRFVLASASGRAGSMIDRERAFSQFSAHVGAVRWLTVSRRLVIIIINSC